MHDDSAFYPARSGQSVTGRRCGRRPSLVRGGVIALVAMAALAGCSAAGATTGDSITASPRLTGATPSEAPSEAPSKLRPPAAPTALHEWVDESSDTVPAYFAWTAPSGPLSGYYFYIKGAWAGDVTPPPAICGSTWEKLPATAKTHTIESVSSQPEAYICAFNDAGTSPTVRFTQDTPLVSTPTKAKSPAAPGGLFAQLTMTGPGSAVAEDLSWTAPSGPIDGYYLKTAYQVVPGPQPPEVCDSSWARLPASATTYHLSDVGTPPNAFICAFNSSGKSPTVKFPVPMPPG